MKMDPRMGTRLLPLKERDKILHLHPYQRRPAVGQVACGKIVAIQDNCWPRTAAAEEGEM